LDELQTGWIGSPAWAGEVIPVASLFLTATSSFCMGPF